jgi:hypothetical protein
MDRSISKYIHGSDDVRLIADSIASSCDRSLQPVRDFLLAKRFSVQYASSYTEAARKRSLQQTTARVLELKSDMQQILSEP